VLPREHRLHRPADFTEVVRRGRRSSRPLVTVHALLRGGSDVGVGSGGRGESVRAGLVVSKAVGGSVVRSTVSRRLRHLLRDRLSLLPAGCRVVVRAGASAGSASSAALAADLDAALPAALRPRAPASPRTGTPPTGTPRTSTPRPPGQVS